MRTCWVVVLLSVLPALAACDVQAADANPPPAREKPKLVCINEAVTGSRLPQRTCMTQADYDERRRHDQDSARRIQDRSRIQDRPEPKPRSPNVE